MRISRLVFIALTVLALTPSIGSAQDRKFHVNLGGGPTFIAADLGDHFSTGWGPAVGVTVDFNKHLGFQFEYAYRWFDIKDDAPLFGATTLAANHQTHQLDFNLVANLAPAGSRVRPYLVGGPGTYNRKVEITDYVGTGIICDPWYYLCGVYPVSEIIGSRSSWDWGYNVGGGVGFRIGGSSEFYVEMRYHHMGGPDIVSTNPLPPAVAAGGGAPGNADGTSYPLTFGFRF